ncbi:TIGR03084 family metal-binding protein [Streptomyces sannanensis]|uniref:TIGR03084 family metal-binding protein n=1 Tax=Streptomyces sannanensis TaxID=285536 RepID=A0ABP6SBG7_9ACTN
MFDPAALYDDLRAESDELDRLVENLSETDWARPTPAPGWTVAHQIAHLAWTDRSAWLAATDPTSFRADVAEAEAREIDLAAAVDQAAEAAVRAMTPAELLARWRDTREQVQEVLRAAPPGARHPWYGPPMSAPSMATARLMETWAHGQDIADALGVSREPTARLRHVARIGSRARDYAYAAHGERPPDEEFRVELTAPDGGLWTYGPESAAQKVTGPALDFCLLTTQRAHRADLAVVAEGPDADHWLDIAQAFAGPPGPGRAPCGRRA